MVGLVGLIKKRAFTLKDSVVFIHSGGIPALFVCDKEIIR